MRFFNELRRRRVFRVAAGYALSAWLLIEVSSVILPAFSAPDWMLQALILLAAAGGIAAVALSWVYDLTDQGIVRTESLAESEEHDAADKAETETERAQRRPVTVLRFKVDSVAANETDAGAEKLYELLPRVQERFEQLIDRHDAHRANIGAGEANVLFGIPVAHEHDAANALRCALAMRDAIAELNVEHALGGADSLHFVAGVDSGMVVAGGGDSREIVGPPLRGSQRLLEHAKADELLATERTLSRAGPGFDTWWDPAVEPEDRVHSVAGLAEGIPASANASSTRSLVGREAELQLLDGRCRRAFDGEGQVVLVSGEPGIGKSRMVSELTAMARKHADVAVIGIGCEALRQGEAWYPVKQLLRKTVLHQVAADDAEQAAQRLGQFVTEQGGDGEIMLPLLCELLDVPCERSARELNLSTERQNQLLFEFLLGALMQRASAQPVLLLGEDVHWADPTTLEFLRAISRQVPSVPMLIALAFRSGFDPQLRQAGHIASISLARLRQDEVTRLIADLVGDTPEASQLAEQIFAKSDGIPLFVEEITRTLVAAQKSSGAPPVLTDDALPATLQESLMWRLDEHGSARAVIQVAAALGREFGFNALAAAGAFENHEALRADLDGLIDGELLVQRGFGPRKTYRFRHALLQDAAYGSLLLKDRKVLHDKIAEVLVALDPKLADENPEQLAFHIERGHAPAAAAQYWQAAGQREARRGANHEAVSNFEKALACLDAADAAVPERDQQILAVLVHLGPAMMALRGYSASEVEAIYQRALALSESVQEPASLAAALFGQWAYHVVRGENPLAADRAERLLALAGQVGDDDLGMEARQALAVTHFHTGELSASDTHLRSVIEVYNPARHADHAFVFGQDPGVASRAYLANLLWCQGHADAAVKASVDAEKLAQKIGHPHSHAFALAFIARLHQHRGDRSKTLAYAERAQKICAENILPVWDAFASMLVGWARALPGDSDEALVMLTSGLGFCGQLGIGISVPYYAVLLGQAQFVHGQPEQGGATMDEAIATARRAGGLIELPEMLRIRAAAIAQEAADHPDIEALLREAIEMATSQGAHAWRLRAASDLTDHLVRQERPLDGMSLLREALAACQPSDSENDQKRASELLALAVT